MQLKSNKEFYYALGYSIYILMGSIVWENFCFFKYLELDLSLFSFDGVLFLKLVYREQFLFRVFELMRLKGDKYIGFFIFKFGYKVIIL